MAYASQSEQSSTDKPSVDAPEIFTVQQKRAGWQFTRRSFLMAAAATTAGCIKPEEATPMLPSTSTPTMSPAMAAAACGDVKAHTHRVRALVVSSDGKLLVSGSEDNTIKLWSLPEGSLLKTLEGHFGNVYTLAISPDGKLLASGGSDDIIKLWSLPEGSQLEILKGHTGYIYALAMSPDGKLLASAGSDDTIKLWLLPEGKLFKTFWRSLHLQLCGRWVYSPKWWRPLK